MPAGDLDLVSPGVEARLYDVPSTQCEGLLRVDPNDPDQSFVLVKLVGPPAGCGVRMPIVGFLSTAEIACVRAWIRDVATGSRPDGGTPDAASDAAGDAASDAASDATSDAASDAASDAPLDVPADIASDAVADGATCDAMSCVDGAMADAGGDGT
jgi:hypothetical protein